MHLSRILPILFSFVFFQACHSSKLLPPCQQLTVGNDQEIFSASDAEAQFGGKWTSSGTYIDTYDKNHCGLDLDGTSHNYTYQIIFQNTPGPSTEKEEVSESISTDQKSPSILSFQLTQRRLLVLCWKKPGGCSKEEIQKISQTVSNKLKL